MDIQTILELITAAVGGGGLVALFLVPEKKASKRLDNAERLILKYEPIIERLEKDIVEKDEQIKRLTKQVNEQGATITELKTLMHTQDIISREDKALRCENTACKKRRPPINVEELNDIIRK